MGREDGSTRREEGTFSFKKGGEVELPGVMQQLSQNSKAKELVGEGTFRQRAQLVEKPKAESCLLYLRNTEETNVAEVECARAESSSGW